MTESAITTIVLMGKQRHELAKGQQITLQIDSLASGGAGVGRCGQVAVFVQRTAPGDIALVEIYDVRQRFAFGRLLELVEASPARTDPPCRLFNACGGCQWQHLTYSGQLEAKEQIVKDAIEKIGALDPACVSRILPAKRTLHYRRKVQFPVCGVKGATRIKAGYYKAGSHQLVNIKHCPIQPQPLDTMLETVKRLAEKHGLRAYDELKRRGFLRHILASFSVSQGKTLVTLVVNAEPQPLAGNIQALACELMDRLPGLAGVCLNYNTSSGNRIKGLTTVCVAGSGHLLETVKSSRGDYPQLLKSGITFRLSAGSFFQVHADQCVRLLETVADAVLVELPGAFADGRHGLLLVDAYAGVGAVAAWLSPFFKEVLAVEESQQAVEDGRASLAMNGIANVSFAALSVEEFFRTFSDPLAAADLVIVDPPRKGLSPLALQHLLAASPRLIIYISCNPATLARDLKEIVQSGYKAKQVKPIDMFPHTFHVETVTILKRLS